MWGEKGERWLKLLCPRHIISTSLFCQPRCLKSTFWQKKKMQEKATICSRNDTLVFICLLFYPSTVLWTKLKLSTLVALTAGLFRKYSSALMRSYWRMLQGRSISVADGTQWSHQVSVRPPLRLHQQTALHAGLYINVWASRVFRSLLSLSFTPRDRAGGPENRSVHAPSPRICARVTCCGQVRSKARSEKKADTHTQSLAAPCLSTSSSH